LDRKWTNIIIWPRDRASISVQQLRIAWYDTTLLYATLRYSTLLYATLLYAILRYSTLLYTIIRYTTLRYSALLCCTLLHATRRDATLLYTALRYAILRYSTLRYSSLFYAILRYSTLLCSTLLYATPCYATLYCCAHVLRSAVCFVNKYNRLSVLILTRHVVYSITALRFFEQQQRFVQMAVSPFTTCSISLITIFAFVQSWVAALHWLSFQNSPLVV
jgi:hypothetical protein